MLSLASVSRRQLLECFSSIGLSATLLPGVVWAEAHQQQPGAGLAATLTREMLRGAAAVAGLTFTDEQVDGMLEGLSQNVERYQELRRRAARDRQGGRTRFQRRGPPLQLGRRA